MRASRTRISSTMDEPEDAKLASLAESLRDPFNMFSLELSNDVASTMVPSVNRIKKAHRYLHDNVDASFGEGLLAFDDACKTKEAIWISDQDEVNATYASAQVGYYIRVF